MKNYAVRYAMLSKRIEIVRLKPGKSGARLVVDRMDATASTMAAVIDMMVDGMPEGSGVSLDFNLGDKRYELTVKELEIDDN